MTVFMGTLKVIVENSKDRVTILSSNPTPGHTSEQNYTSKRYMGGHLQDGGGVRCGDHLPPYKYIKTTSTCGTTPTEYLLNAGKRPQTS